MYFSDIQDPVYEIEESVTESADSITKSQKEALEKRFGRNLKTWRVLIGNDFIAIPRSLHNNWLYYAGFEYIDDGFDICLENYYIYSDSSERVSDILELLKED
jgi:hypothetical protein